MSLVTELIDISKFIYKQIEDFLNFIYYFTKTFVRDYPIITTILLLIFIIILFYKVSKYLRERKINLENIRRMNEQINFDMEKYRINQQFIYTFQDYLDLDAERHHYDAYYYQALIQNNVWDVNSPYQKRFQFIWSVYRQTNCVIKSNSSFHASYLDAHILKAIIPEEELESFVSVMYSNALLLQVVHGMDFQIQAVTPSFDIEVKENMFPRVNGILSTINRYVCPALLPTMLLYITVGKMNKGDYLHYDSTHNLELEKNTWKDKRKIFDDGINDAIKNLSFLLEIMLGSQCDIEKLVKDELLEEHKKLARAILSGDTSLRVTNKTYL